MTALGDRPPPPLVTAADADADVLFASRTEPDRFAALFDRHHADIRRYAASRLGGGRADDVAAETFLVAFRTRGRYTSRPGGSVRAWLFGIATNLIRRQHRDEERRYRALARAAFDEPPQSGDESAVARVAARAIRPDLARALADLHARDRDVLLLTAIAQLDYAEVSAALGIPPGTVGSRLNRARKSIRAVLGGADPTRIDEGDS